MLLSFDLYFSPDNISEGAGTAEVKGGGMYNTLDSPGAIWLL